LSAFLGPVHHWLYHKIQWHETLLEELLALPGEGPVETGTLVGEMNASFGEPVRGDLSRVINHTDIHGWLQERITSLELRTAYLVTFFLGKGIIDLDSLEDFYREYGKRTMTQEAVSTPSPEALFKVVNDHLLEGMPCETINQPVLKEKDAFGWRESRCIHKDHWDRVQGDVTVFYRLRNALVEGFVLGTGGKLTLEILGDGTKIIREVA
jgi:hypothetical protein